MKKPIKTNNMAQTSVDWLVEKLQESGITLLKDEFEMIEQAKEMHKEELANAYEEGWKDASKEAMKETHKYQ